MPEPTRREPPRSETTHAFAVGVCSALAVIANHDYESLWREVVASCGGYDYLHGISKRAGQLRIDGFTQYKKQGVR